MDLKTFLNCAKILRSVDHHEVAHIMDAQAWAVFCADPAGWLIYMNDESAAALWAVVQKRASENQASGFDAYMHRAAGAAEMAILLQGVRDFVESEVENRGAAGSEMSDYQDEAAKALEDLNAALGLLN